MIDVYEAVIQKVRTIDYDGPMSVHSAQDAYDILKAYGLPEKAEERIVLLAFSGDMHLIGMCEVAAGTVERCETTPRDLFKRAILLNSSGVVIAHNHFSKGTLPSDGDIVLTKQLIEAGELLGVDLLDHIIVGLDGEWTSMLELGYFEDIKNGKFDSLLFVSEAERSGEEYNIHSD